MIVAVTGSEGFIGAATVRALLDAGHEVIHFDRSLDHDVRDPDVTDDVLRPADAVIHLAGVLGTSELFDQVHRAISVNVAGTANVLDTCKRHGLAYVGITMPDCWPSLYQATKLAGVRIAEAYHHAHGVPVTHIRAFNAYGPGQAYGPTHPQKIIPTFATKAWRGEPMPIWGDGSQTVDLVHVDHIARCLMMAATATLVLSDPMSGTWTPQKFYGDYGSGQTWDAGSGQELTVVQVARIVATITKQPCEVEFLPMRAGELPNTKLCATAPGPLGFAPSLMGLKTAVESYAPARVEAVA